MKHRIQQQNIETKRTTGNNHKATQNSINTHRYYTTKYNNIHIITRTKQNSAVHNNIEQTRQHGTNTTTSIHKQQQTTPWTTCKAKHGQIKTNKNKMEQHRTKYKTIHQYPLTFKQNTIKQRRATQGTIEQHE